MSAERKATAAATVAGWMILLVPLAVFVLFLVYPLVRGMALSFQEWSLFGAPKPAGLSNYQKLMQDASFVQALGGTYFSPLLALRVILLAAAPLSIACLLMQLQAGARLGLHALLSLLVVFSGAFVMAFFSMLAMGRQTGGDPLLLLTKLLVSNGLAYSIPLGTALFLAMARGTGVLSAEKGFTFSEFWARSPRLIIAYIIGALGFSILGLQARYGLPLQAGLWENLFTYQFRAAFQMMKVGQGAAVMTVLAVPLLLLGLAFMLVLETPGSRISIRIQPGTGGRLSAGGDSPAAAAVFGVIAAVSVAIAAAVCIPPLVGALGSAVSSAAAEQGPGPAAADSAGAFITSLRIAAGSALGCLFLCSIAGLALGRLQPRGARAALIVVGSFIFIGPAVLLIPDFLLFRNLGIVNTRLSVILPCLFSPLGVLLFTWFFRGLGEDAASGNRPSPGSAFGRWVIFSLPLLALFILVSINQSMLPLTMLSNKEAWPLSLSAIISLRAFAGGGAQRSTVMLLIAQYALPVVLLLVSCAAAFPRMALVQIRREDARAAVENKIPEQPA